MSLFLLSQLRYTLTQLDGQGTTSYSPFEQQTLRLQLTSTLKTLHELYPDSLSSAQRQEFITGLLPLEQQFLHVTQVAPMTIPLATWQTVHQSLHTVITNSLRLFSAS